MKPRPFISFPSYLFSSFPVLGSVTVPACASSHSFQREETLETQNASSFTETEFNHVHYTKDFHALIRILSNNSRNCGALSALDSMLTKTHYLDSATSLLIIDGLSRLKKLGKAQNVLSNLRKKGKVSDYLLYSFVFHCLLKDGRIEDFESVWDDVCGSELSWMNRRIDASEFVVRVCKSGEVLEIERICKRVLRGCWDLKQQSYIALTGALCRNNNGLLAKELLREMESNMGLKGEFGGIGVSSCMVMIKGLCDQENASKALSIFEEMLKNHIPTNEALYEIIIRGLCLSGRLEEAHKYLNKMIENGLRMSYIMWKSLSDSFLTGSKR